DGGAGILGHRVIHGKSGGVILMGTNPDQLLRVFCCLNNPYAQANYLSFQELRARLINLGRKRIPADGKTMRSCRAAADNNSNPYSMATPPSCKRKLVSKLLTTTLYRP